MTQDAYGWPTVPPRSAAHPLDGVSPHPTLEAVVTPIKTLREIGAPVYISGPMTGYERYNYPFFDRVAEVLRGMEVQVVSPSEIDSGAQVNGYSEEKPYGYYLTEALRLQLQAGAWLGLPGWTKSKGAKREFDIALDLDHRTFIWREDRGVTGTFWIEEIG